MLQMVSWTSRLLTSILLALCWLHPDLDYLHFSHIPPSSRSRAYFSASLALELYVRAFSLPSSSTTKYVPYQTTLYSLLVLRLQKPPTVRLIDASTHLRASSPTPTTSRAATSLTIPPQEPDLLASLSLSSKPIISTPSNPIFGLPSLPPSNTSTSSLPSNLPDEDAMDWTPTNPSSASSSKGKYRNRQEHDDESQGDKSLLRPQQFFPPEHPTGLEGLFARTTFFAEESTSRQRARYRGRGSGWLWVYGLSLIPLAGVAFKAWERARKGTDGMKS
jgi:hypothetical protein